MLFNVALPPADIGVVGFMCVFPIQFSTYLPVNDGLDGISAKKFLDLLELLWSEYSGNPFNPPSPVNIERVMEVRIPVATLHECL